MKFLLRSPRSDAVSARTVLISSLFLVALPSWAAAAPRTNPLIQDETDAREMFDRGQTLEVQGRLASALEKYRALIEHFPETDAAASAQFRIGYLYQANREYEKAFNAYQAVIDDFPTSDLFLQALQAEYELVSDAIRQRDSLRRHPGAQLPFELPEPDLVQNMLRVIVTNAKFSEFAPKTYFLLAASYQQDEDLEKARTALNTVLDNYPSSEYVDDATFQLAYLDYLRATAKGAGDATRANARIVLEEFVARFPKSDKAPQATHLLRQIDVEHLRSLLTSAGYYRRQGKSGAAAQYAAGARELLARIEIESLPADLQRQVEDAELAADAEEASGAPKKLVDLPPDSATPPDEEKKKPFERLRTSAERLPFSRLWNTFTKNRDGETVPEAE